MSQLTSKLYIIRTNKRGHATTSEASVNENEGCGHFAPKYFGSQNKGIHTNEKGCFILAKVSSTYTRENHD